MTEVQIARQRFDTKSSFDIAIDYVYVYVSEQEPEFVRNTLFALVMKNSKGKCEGCSVDFARFECRGLLDCGGLAAAVDQLQSRRPLARRCIQVRRRLVVFRFGHFSRRTRVALTSVTVMVDTRKTVAANAHWIVQLLARQWRRVLRTISAKYFTATSTTNVISISSHSNRCKIIFFIFVK